MNERIIGSMQIENERIEIFETNPINTVEDRKTVYQNIEPDIVTVCKTSICYGAIIVSEWFARVGEQNIAYACLLRCEPPETVYLAVFVVPERRGYGIGKLMTRFATDLAIRHRQRRITAGPVTPIFKAILEAEEFESDKNGVISKELKWQ